MFVAYVDIAGQFKEQRSSIMPAIERVLESGQLIMGEEVEKFERSFAEICKVPHAISVANGTDALIIALKALGIGPGDDVIVPANSWISSASCIALVGAKPVFIDVRKDQNLDPALLETVCTANTKAIIPVHLGGKCADMDPILEFARNRGLKVIEDAAQSIGSKYKGRTSGSMADIACFSLHPLKNLNATGDAGIITTKDNALAEKMRLLRQHGLENRNEVSIWGLNSRLDAVQAAVLNCRVPDLPTIIEKRRANAKLYREKLAGLESQIQLPQEAEACFDTYHLFVIQTDRRTELAAFLSEKNIQTAVHYPIPIHLQKCSSYLGYGRGSLPNVESQADKILSLPIHQGLQRAQVEYVAEMIQSFFKQYS